MMSDLRRKAKRGLEEPHLISRFILTQTLGRLYSSMERYLTERTEWYPKFKNRRYVGSELGDLVLDIGCNWGRQSLIQHRLGREVVGLDIDDYDRWKQLDSSFIEADAQQLPFGDGEIDVAIVYLSLEYMEDDTAVIREINRVLTDDGRIALAVANKDNLYTRWTGEKIDTTKQREYSRTEIESRVSENGFTIEQCWTEKIYFPVLMPTLNTLLPKSVLLALGYLLPEQYRGIIHLKARKS